MIPELLAIFAAILWGVQITLSRKGLLTLPVTSGLLINLVVGTIVLWSLTFIFLPSLSLDSRAFMLFALAGAIAPFLGRLFLFDSIRRLGSSLAGPLYGSFPLFASITAVIFLGEKITLLIFLGTLTIILGVGIISIMEIGPRQKFRKLDLCIPILAAFCFGFSGPIRKLGLDLLDFPILGAAVGSLTALACLTFLLIFRGELSFPINEEGSIYFVMTGLVTSIALVALFFALSFGTVVLVIPLMGTSPLFVLIFSRIFFKRIEKITPFLVIGAILIVAGSALVTIG